MSFDISGSVSPFVAAFFIGNYGWRTSVLAAGGLSLVMGIVSLLTLINTPADIGLRSFAKPPRKISQVGTATVTTHN